MADLKIKYGTWAPITCTFGGLTTGAARESNPVDNSAAAQLAVDAMFQICAGLNTGGTTGNDNALYIYFYGSNDDGKYSDNVAGGDAAITLRNPNNLAGPFTINIPTATNGTITYGVVPSVASYFGGVLPRKWGFVIKNAGNVILAATATCATTTAGYCPVYYQTV